ncbi:MAG: response regulator [Candidatus Promineifilaceae bacterium]|nr:response regulator [Candidatus Promineifilaceae bacterium]
MTQSATILLVEDDRSILNGIADLLQLFEIGYDLQVLKATDGVEGLARMEEAVPDLIISDIMMPRLNGFGFLEAVRANPTWIHIPVIFLSARGTRDEVFAGRRSGAELYITKPFVSDELIELVKSQLDRTFQLQKVRERELEELKRNLLQLLNHEFRTPLTYVTAYYEMLSDSLVGLDDPAQLQEYLRGIQVGSARLTELVEDLIKIVEIRTGEAATHFGAEAQRIERTRALLNQQIERFQAAAHDADITLTTDIPPELPAVYGVPSQLQDAISRLLDNAIKFTRYQSRGQREVAVRASATEDKLSIAVSDTGIGFPPHVHDQLFDLFYQHNREQLEQQGSGAGLAIARGLVELHGGIIEVESRENEGSTFIIKLPVAGKVPPPGERNQQREVSRRATVLVVEDDHYLLNGLKEILELPHERYRLDILTATNGQEGLAVLDNHQPDLIISDVMMPVMDGFTFLQKVRENPLWLQIPFIFLTAKGEPEDVHRGRRSGAEEYITKPYSIDELRELTFTQLDRHFQRRGAASQNFEALKRGVLNMLQPEFKGPLALVRRYSQRLAEELENVETDQALMSSLQIIQANSERLSHLVEDFIAMAEFKTGEARSAFDMRAETVDPISVVLYEAAYTRQYQAEQEGIEMSYDLEEALPAVYCHRERLTRACGRLLDMMTDLCRGRKGGRITLKAYPAAQNVCLMFHVRGGSLPEEEASRAARFFAEEGAESMLEISRYGPSLTVVKQTIALHGGEISLKRPEAAQMIIYILLPPATRQEAG